MMRVSRARSVRSTQPFEVAVFFSSLCLLGLVGIAVALGWLCVRPSVEASVFFLIAAFFSALSWLVAYFKRRKVRCPLCKGTPLVSSGALPHARAKRTRPFNHGWSAIFSIMATRKFRCMYCASDYDLKKPCVSRRPHGGSREG